MFEYDEKIIKTTRRARAYGSAFLVRLPVAVAILAPLKIERMPVNTHTGILCADVLPETRLLYPG